MDNRETQFLIDLISNKYLKGSERKKALELAFKELGENSISMSEKRELRGYLIEASGRTKNKEESTDQNRIIKSVELGQSLSKSESKKSEEPEVNHLPPYVDPKATTRFLLEFNQNLILKPCTHPVDSNLLEDILQELNLETYSFKKHREAIEKEYRKLSSKYFKRASDNLRTKIYSYLIGDKKGNGSWSADSIKYSWSCNELKEWALNNPGKVPNPDSDLDYTGFKIPRLKLANGEKYTKWNDLVLYFKKQLTISLENNLEDLISSWVKEWCDENQKEIDLSFETMNKGVRFDTDVEKIKQLILQLCRICTKYDEKSDKKTSLKISQREESKSGRVLVLAVCHQKSIFRKSLNSTLGRPIGKDLRPILSNQINGLCDWSIKAEFSGQEYAEVQIWPRPSEDYESKRLDTFEGVQYEFKFYMP
jgi:hypothetical protein